MGWFLYQVLLGAALLLAAPFLLLRRGAHYLPTLRGRLGRGVRDGGRGAETTGGDRGKSSGGGLWIHAVSVGEVGVAATLARQLPEGAPRLVTTITPTGQARARAAFRDRASVAYLPFDLGFAVSRFFRRWRPEALVLVEGDYWPLVLREAGRRGLPVAVVNGRVGDRSYRRLRRLQRFAPGPLTPRSLLFGRVGRFGVQTDEDRRRLLTLGVEPDRVVVTGNLKYETPEPPRRPELERAFEALAGDRPVLVAGSTMGGEEERVLEAFAEIGGGGRALLVLAPRHPERWNEVAARIEASGVRFLRRSALEPGGASPADGLQAADRPDVVLLDSLGELAGLYRLARAAFIGGTLRPAGGHNPLEAARWAVPVAVGPSMENFRQIAEEFDGARAWRRVRTPSELAAAWREWLEHPERAHEVGRRGERLVAANRGAAEATVKLLREFGVWS